MFYFAVIAAVILNIIFYGFGQSSIALTARDLEALEQKTGYRKYSKISGICEKPVYFICTLHIITILCDFGIGYCICRHFGTGDLGGGIAAALVITGIFFFVRAVFSRKLAQRFKDKIAVLTINLIYFISILISPITWIYYRISCILAFCMGLGRAEVTLDVTEEEIISMVNEGHEQGVLQESEASMINNIFKLGDMEAQDIMTNRKNISALDGEITLREAIHTMLKEGKSRYPVYLEDIDHIIGILNFRDAINAQEDSNSRSSELKLKSLKGLLREPVLIPETRNIDSLFKNMQSSKTQMVIVVDEYGQTAGLVAMEDIIEEIVGNIMDEYDKDEGYIEKRQNYMLVSGLTPLEILEDKLGIVFEDDRFETINGYFISRMEHIPKEDEAFSLQLGDYNFEIHSVKNKVIDKIKVTKNIAIQQAL